MRDVWATTREQRRGVHKTSNVLDKLPKSVHPKAKKMPHEVMNAPTLAECDKAIDDLVVTYDAKYPKAAGTIVDGRGQLLTFFDFPAEHWLQRRATNPIESTFVTVKLRQRVTKAAGLRAAGLAMTFRSRLAAERTWRRLNGHEKLPLVRAGVRFQDGVCVGRNNASASIPRPINTTRRTKKTNQGKRKRKITA